MDDYNISMLSEAKNEYCIRLVNILTPLLIEGVKSVFSEVIFFIHQLSNFGTPQTLIFFKLIKLDNAGTLFFEPIKHKSPDNINFFFIFFK